MESGKRPEPTRLVRSIWLSILAIAGCSFAGRTANPRSTFITPAEATAWLTVGESSASFEIPIIVRNASDATIYTEWCSVNAQRFIDGTWQTVFRASCLALSDPTPIPPGHSLTVTLHAFGRTELSAAPKLDPRMTPGLYRAIVYLFTVDGTGHRIDLPERERESSTFTVARK